jgi:hypothetical protein
MVTKPNTPTPATGQEPVKKLPKVEPAELATNASQNPKYVADPATSVTRKDVANADYRDNGAEFKLPEKVTQAQIRDQSFKYGGGRSAGNRSLEANQKLQRKQP